MSGPRVAILDIETRPAVVEAWGLHKQWISIDQIRDPGGIIGFGAKWRGERGVTWADDRDREVMVDLARNFLDTADVVVTYNGDSFDLPILKRDILLAGLTPPSPFKSVDLYRVVKRNFKFLSGKLDFVAQQLGVGSKIKHQGYSLWQEIMAGDEAAYRKMSRYCRGDVVLTERVHDALLPWIKGYPNVGLWSDKSGHVCPRCESTNVQRRGNQVALAMTYQRFQCLDCGSWSRSAKGESIATDLRSV